MPDGAGARRSRCWSRGAWPAAAGRGPPWSTPRRPAAPDHHRGHLDDPASDHGHAHDRGIPTTTGRVPLTTGQTGPAGAPLTFRHLTIRLGKGWRAGGGGDHVEVATSQACRRSAGGVDCPGFLLLGPSQIAIASQLGPYDPDTVWHPGAGVEGCPQDRDGLAEVPPAKPAKKGVAKVGGKDAVYREWRIGCVDARTGEPETGYTQRVWYLGGPGSWSWTSGRPRAEGGAGGRFG